jgi:hypothetical protein
MTHTHTARRLPDWPTRLDAHVHAHRARPFTWGPQDCVSFAAGAVAAITGQPVQAPAWQGRRAAVRLLRQMGGVQGVAARTLGALQPAASARRGDVVLLQQDGRHLLAVCLGHLWVAPGAQGLAFGPMSQALGAWRVG